MSELSQDRGRSEGSSPGGSADILNATELSAKLDRVLQAVENQQRQGQLELVLVIVLALTALASTWCAYQSQLWNGVQIVRLADAEIASQEARSQALMSIQRRTNDGLAVLHLMDAMQRNDTKASEAIRRRMQSPLAEAVEASLALDVMNNPNVPGPLRMPQYVLVEEEHARQAQDRALELRGQAQAAGTHGDTYVLLTLLFASVLFFGGITGTFRSRRLRIGLAVIACVMFFTTVGFMATMPVCHD